MDSETNFCIRFPAQCPGGEAQALAARQRLVEVSASGASLAAGLRNLTEEQRALVDTIILDCVKDADFLLNEKLFGGSPTREQCAEVLERDANGKPVTRAMRLGLEKHEAAMACIQEKLPPLRQGGFSLNQRYRLNPHTGKWEPLSRQQVEALLRTGGKDLVGTIEPDVVIHTGNVAEVLDVYDLKFPCPGTNPPTWRTYGEGHPYRGADQGSTYQQAFGGNPARVAPRWGVLRGNP
ncbi:hypothetical protein [Hyalangium versicolor]|uniref:hypothetical protein n=1 Tax=Hyalangium versicolor TaxID=2861190 RepID=UPI001CCED9B9|nr:hypothetical protein [Hyalangium versicolor]